MSTKGKSSFEPPTTNSPTTGKWEKRLHNSSKIKGNSGWIIIFEKLRPMRLAAHQCAFPIA